MLTFAKLFLPFLWKIFLILVDLTGEVQCYKEEDYYGEHYKARSTIINAAKRVTHAKSARAVGILGAAGEFACIAGMAN